MLGNVRARKYSKTGARARSILEKFAFDTTLFIINPLTSHHNINHMSVANSRKEKYKNLDVFLYI